MNRSVLAVASLLLVIALSGCTDSRTPADYASDARGLVQSGDEGRALEVIRSGIYRYPDDYDLNVLMARTLIEHYTDITPHARSRYLARYYLKRAIWAAPDARRKSLARTEYERIKEMQR